MDDWWEGFPSVTWATIALLFSQCEYPTPDHVAMVDGLETVLKNEVARELAKHHHHR